MSIKHSKYIIIGAGLSGLTTAYQLLKYGESDFKVLEGRDHVGGRIDTSNGVDLGATWLQDHHQYLRQLMTDLRLKKFEQYNQDRSILVYNSMAPAHYFEHSSNEPSAYRIVDGSMALIDALVHSCHDKIVLNSKVISVSDKGEKLFLNTHNETYSCEQLIVTTPPKLASTIAFEPQLPDDLIEVMIRTHTWMSNAIKIGITFQLPFWRNRNLSGTIISQVSPITELYDHCDYQQTTFSLMGFANEALRDETMANRKEAILSYLEKYLGSEIRNYINYVEKDWSTDSYTSNEQLKSIYMSPHYGNPLFQRFYLGDKVLFSGTETSQIHGGYMEGAVYSGINAVNKLLNN